MEFNSKKSFYDFLLVAKRKGVPQECARIVLQHLCGVQGYLHRIFSKFVLLSQMKESDACLGKLAMMLEVDLTEHDAEACYFNGMLAPLRKERGRYLVGDISAHEALIVEGLDPGALQAMHNVLQPSTLLTKESFDFFFRDEAVHPYAAFVAGVTSDILFHSKFRTAAVRRGCIYHFTLLGALSCRSNRGYFRRFEADLELLIDVLRFAESIRRVDLVRRMEQWLNFDRTGPVFVQEVVRALLRLEARALHPNTLARESALLEVLDELVADTLEGKVPESVLERYALMLEESRRKDFHRTFRAVLQTAFPEAHCMACCTLSTSL